MDQTLVNWALSGFGFILGWLLKVVWDALKELRVDLHEIEVDMPKQYVQKVDFKDVVSGLRTDLRENREDNKAQFDEIKSMIGKIFDRLEERSK